MKHTRFFVEDILRPDFGNSSLNHLQSDDQEPQRQSEIHSPRLTTSDDEHKDDVVKSENDKSKAHLWPAWVYCTRYSDRPSSGPRTRKVRKRDKPKDEKRPRTAFTTEQLERLKVEFTETQYLSEERRRTLANELNLNEAQIKIWFQNKRAKLKKSTPIANPLAQQLMEQGLYNHATSNTDVS